VDGKEIHKMRSNSFKLKCLKAVKDSTSLVGVKNVDVKNNGK
jgi:hypothetical protein